MTKLFNLYSAKLFKTSVNTVVGIKIV